MQPLHLEDLCFGHQGELLSYDAQVEEYGDLLFVMANFARHLKIDPEEALRAANEKFKHRFEGVEQKLAAISKSPAQSNLDEMNTFWNIIKQSEKS